jgi:hypothetical protein
MEVGMVFCGLTISAKASKRASGIATIPELGSMVQNGKFSAPMPDLVSALNKVDLPTFGNPTMPHLKPMMITFNYLLILLLVLIKRYRGRLGKAKIKFNEAHSSAM